MKLKGHFYLAIGDKRWNDVSLREGVFQFKKMIERNTRLKSFPDFWCHYELKADALSYLNRTSEAIAIYRITIDKLNLDKEISKYLHGIFIKQENFKNKAPLPF